MKQQRKIHQRVSLVMLIGAAMMAHAPMSAQVLVLDDFSAGDIVVNTTVTSTFGNPVPGVFGGNRSILLTKAVESSATAITVGSGVLTWNGTAQGDYGWVGYGDAYTDIDLSAYNAFRITVDSTPPNPGQLAIDLYYFGSPTHTYGVKALVALPTSGTVDIPYSSFVANAANLGFPPIDFTQVHAVALAFGGDVLSQGTYVLDNFQAVVVPEPSAWALFSFGCLAVWLTIKPKRYAALQQG